MTDAEVAESLRVLLLAHPEVIALYSTQPVVTEIAARALPAIVPGFSAPQPVRVDHAAAGTTVFVRVGLSGRRSATQVCRELHDLIVASLGGDDAPAPLTVSVTVSSVA